MDGHRYVVAKGVIIEDIDTEEENNVDEPASERDLILSKEKRRSRGVELGNVPSDGHE